MACTHCGKPAHTPANCWTLHPEQMVWKWTNAVEEEGYEEENGFDVGAVEVEKVQRARSPPVLATWNRFDALRDEEEQNDVKIGGLDIEDPECGINMIKHSGRLVKAGMGNITVDSGAAESVMPRGMLENEELVEGAAKLSGVRYVAANGARMENSGEKRVKFKCTDSNVMNKITFQVTEVGSPSRR